MESSTGTYLSAVFSLLFVIALILIIAQIAKRYISNSSYNINRKKRIPIKEVTVVDGKRRLILVGRDDKEHLLLIGGGQDIIIEKDITPPEDSINDPKKSEKNTDIDDNSFDRHLKPYQDKKREKANNDAACDNPDDADEKGVK